MTRRPLAIAIALSATTLTFAGCGGGSSSPSASAQKPAGSGKGGGAHAHARRHRSARRSQASSARTRAAASRSRPAAHRSAAARPAARAARRGLAEAGTPSALKSLVSTVQSAGNPSGSGSGGKGSIHFVSTGGPVSRFVTSADQICGSYRATVRGIGAGATTLSRQENELPALVQATVASLKRLRALSPPRADAALAERFVTLTSASVADYIYAQSRTTSTSENQGVSAEDTDMKLAQRSASDAVAAAAAARRLGLQVCGSPGAEWL